MPVPGPGTKRPIGEPAGGLLGSSPPRIPFRPPGRTPAAGFLELDESESAGLEFMISENR
jgi:hypothetical protein